jgi:hypothetical protein
VVIQLFEIKGKTEIKPVAGAISWVKMPVLEDFPGYLPEEGYLGSEWYWITSRLPGWM